MQFFPALLTASETADMLARWTSKQRRYSHAFAAVKIRHDQQLIGLAGLSRLEENALIELCSKIGWRLTPSAWHQGYATEAARVRLDYSFDELGLAEILTYMPRHSIVSQRVMQHFGMQHADALDFNCPSLAKGHPLRRMVL